MNAVEEKRKPAFKRVKKNSELPVKEAPKLFYTVIVNNKREQSKEPEDIINQGIEKNAALLQFGLPPQPTGYLRYPDYDCL